MKVAVLLTGHIRSHEETSASLFRHLLDLYDCDVYCSTWAANGDKNAREEVLLRNLHGERLKKIHIEDPKVYNEKKIVYKREGERDEPVYPRGERKERLDDGRLFYLKAGVKSSNGIRWVNRLSDQFYLVKQGFNLIRDRYDVVIRIRFDALLLQPLRLSTGTLTVPYFFGEYHITDHFAYGEMEDMGENCDLHSHMKDLHEDLGVDISSAEGMMYDYLLQYCKMPIKVQNFKYKISRPSEGFKSFDVRNTIDAFPQFGPN